MGRATRREGADAPARKATTEGKRMGRPVLVVPPGPRLANGELSWSRDEDFILLTFYPQPSRRARVWTALPHRSRVAIHHRARLLGVSKPAPAPWTAREDRILRAEWGDMQMRGLRAKLPGRTAKAVTQRAYMLGLPPARQGHPSLCALAEEAGFSRDALVRILDEEGVRLHHRPGPTDSQLREVPQYTADSDGVRAAVERALARRAAEGRSLGEIARSIGANRGTLRRALASAGFDEESRPHVSDEEARAAVAARLHASSEAARDRARRMVRAHRGPGAGPLSLLGHAQRLGVWEGTVARAARAAGLIPEGSLAGRVVSVSVEAMDAALEAWRAAHPRGGRPRQTSAGGAR